LLFKFSKKNRKASGLSRAVDKKYAEIGRIRKNIKKPEIL
tara:strand:+ start:230 stop:349 length:120 start_codon:yes stop_codon:yes gene_type:complete